MTKKIWRIQRILIFLLVAAAGSLLHFVWEHIYTLPAAQILAPLIPVNESYWEHIKMAVTPLSVYFIIQYFLNFKSKLPKGTWVIAASAGLWSAVLSMFMIHAALVAVFGGAAELAISIITFFINVFIGMSVFHYLQHSKGASRYSFWGWTGLIILYLSLIVYSYYPLHIELFKSRDMNYFGQFRG